MRVVGTSSSRRYKLAQAAAAVAATGQGHFEECTILLHLFAGLALVIADLNYCLA